MFKSIALSWCVITRSGIGRIWMLIPQASNQVHVAARNSQDLHLFWPIDKFKIKITFQCFLLLLWLAFRVHLDFSPPGAGCGP
jgi:hypothetical protein